MDKIPLEIIDRESVIRFRDCFSVRYIQSAALLCRLGYVIEKNYEETGEISPDLILQHEAFILNSVLSSVAFLESVINEFYSDAADNAYFFADVKNEELLRDIREKWRNEKNFDRAPVITKFQRILAIGGKSPFDNHNPVVTDIHTLIDIRNFLMHYKREWIVVQNGGGGGELEKTQAEKFENLLKTKFRENPLAQKNQQFFPDKCLGHGCAEWAVVNCIEFTDAFFTRLELPAPYEGIKQELGTK
jgi:hypothetical protein